MMVVVAELLQAINRAQHPANRLCEASEKFFEVHLVMTRVNNSKAPVTHRCMVWKDILATNLFAIQKQSGQQSVMDTSQPGFQLSTFLGKMKASTRTEVWLGRLIRHFANKTDKELDAFLIEAGNLLDGSVPGDVRELLGAAQQFDYLQSAAKKLRTKR